jgi:phosphoribosylaminoimidazolecarboxamide formyltransferase / IMP cyclohydrolase
MQKTALLSVSDKTGLVEFATALARKGVKLIASGGTAARLVEAGLTVASVSSLTGFPEILGGRVKTLHPMVHGGILATRSTEHLDELKSHGIGAIDLVVCNLYPFSQTVARADVTFDAAIEQIDIGGVTLLRAAAKNCAHVTVVCEPSDYQHVLDTLQDSNEQSRKQLALKAFRHTAAYDQAISTYMNAVSNPDTELADVTMQTNSLVSTLRYGENPHQTAGVYLPEGASLGFEVLQGKPMSYNNLIDLEGAWQAVSPFDRPAVAIIKHTNPCGLAMADDLETAFDRALKSDPVSAFGSIIAVNRIVTESLLEKIGKLFVEVLAAPDFTEGALAWLAAKKKNCRAARMSPDVQKPLQYRSCLGIHLVQNADVDTSVPTEWRVCTENQPTESEMKDLQFAWEVARNVKSNAIVMVKNEATVGVGAGQMNRLESVCLAAKQAGDEARGAVLASDAFFPFADGLEAAASSGVSAIIQPGGSIRDDEVIAAANRMGIAMVLTGRRHFKH